MTQLTVELDEQFADTRTDHLAFRLTITNGTGCDIHVLSIRPRGPKGVRLVAAIDSSDSEARTRRDKLLDELTILFNERLKPRTMGTVVKDLFYGMHTVIGLPFTAHIASSLDLLSRQEACCFRIFDSTDAKYVLDKWFAKERGEETPWIFSAKTEQLARLEAAIARAETSDSVTIAAGERLCSTYVVGFSRNFFEPRKFQVAFMIAYKGAAAGDGAKTHLVATNVQISPKPVSMALFSIVAGLLGVIVKNLTSPRFDALLASGKPELRGFFTDANMVKEVLLGAILAFVFFHIYEYTALAEKFKMAISWRSALLIGTLAGYSSERIVAALVAVLGAP